MSKATTAELKEYFLSVENLLDRKYGMQLCDRLDAAEKEREFYHDLYIETVDEVAQATIERVRTEYGEHVKDTKSPVMVLDAIGWILEAES